MPRAVALLTRLCVPVPRPQRLRKAPPAAAGAADVPKPTDSAPKDEL